MPRSHWLLLAACLLAPGALAQAPPPATAVAANQAFGAALKDLPAHLQVEVPVEVDLVEEASLPVYAAKPLPAAGRSKAASPEEGPACRRQLVFVLQPKERLSLTLETVDFNKVHLHFGIPADPAHPLAAQLQRVKRIHPLVRAKGVAFVNESGAPTEVVAVLSGYEKYAYKLKVQRSR